MLISQNTAAATLYDKIIEAKTAREVEAHVRNIPQEAVIFLDIDDTVITPKSKTFRSEPYKRLIDDIKQHKEKYENYEEIVSNWRLQRKAILVDSEWPAVIKEFKKSYKVYGLTKMDSGRFGNIESMEKWRFDELKSLGVEFSQNSALQKYKIEDSGLKNRPVFYNGIFITGTASKRLVLELYKQHSAKFIVMVDDRLEHVHDIQNYCRENSISFLGIIFRGAENLQGRPNPEIAAFQKDYLIKNAQWLEDEEVERSRQ